MSARNDLIQFRFLLAEVEHRQEVIGYKAESEGKQPTAQPAQDGKSAER